MHLKHLLLTLTLSLAGCADAPTLNRPSLIGFWRVTPYETSPDDQLCFVEVNDSTCVYWLESVGYPFPSHYTIRNDSLFLWQYIPSIMDKPTEPFFRGIIIPPSDTSVVIEGAAPKLLLTKSTYEQFVELAKEPCWNCRY